MSTLNVGTANATTVNVGTGGIRFSDTTTMTTAPVTDIALNDINNVSAASLAQIKFCNGMDLHGSMLMPLVVLRQELEHNVLVILLALCLTYAIIQLMIT